MVTNLAIVAQVTICDHCLVLGLIAPELNSDEDNGWADWSGLATLLADVGRGASNRLERLLS